MLIDASGNNEITFAHLSDLQHLPPSPYKTRPRSPQRSIVKGKQIMKVMKTKFCMKNFENLMQIPLQPYYEKAFIILF